MIQEEIATIYVPTTMGFNQWSSSEMLRLKSVTIFPQLCKKINESMQEIFGNGELDEDIDDAVKNAVKEKKGYKTKVKTEYLSNNAVCDCVHCNPYVLKFRNVFVPPS